MRGLTKRIGVGVMAASLVMSSSLVAFAADPAGTGTSGGTGSIEGVVKTDVYTAVLPTESTSAYTYIADPQGLIRKTDAAKYDGAEFGEGTIFFTNAGENNKVSYSNTSDAAKIVNQSSKNLSVSVTATATEAANGATLAAAKSFTGTSKEVYLGITDSVEGNGEKPLTTTGATMTAVLGAAPEDAYEYSYVKDGADAGYKYTLKSDVSAFKFAEYSFQITGAANDKATDWAADTALPSVSVTWTVDLTDDAATVATPAQEAAPSISASSYQYTAGQNLDITVNLGAGDLAASDITSVTFENNGATTSLPTTRWSYNAGKLTFNDSYTTALAGKTRTHTITFNDKAGTSVDVTLEPAP